ncbi:hypothetical protein [Chryseobacterium sp. MFBS3-17]|uniref:hypothetical protein n=1 Tax=Chryseobacterium sp. MFBS3-17 TaxID=2886689 RepID=UPI001D0F13F4|nr:hypothetical protein [Chryseobacterium sp. MFBS3-17]MCC2591006.1 hypothetical protein [Chryseobacterium sp. MFBS3-17]
MKKIAYIELDTHAEIALNFMELMQDSAVFDTDYYVSGKVYRQTGGNRKQVFMVESADVLPLLQKKSYDLVIIGTAHRYFNVFKAIAARYNTAVIVHNQNFTFLSRFDLLRKVLCKDRLYRLKLLLKEGLLTAPDFYNSVNHRLVLDSYLERISMRFLPVFYRKYKDEVPQIPTVVIPGSVSQSRRDYARVFEVIQNMESGSSKVQFVFAGRAEGRELAQLRKLENSVSENISLQYFTEKIDQHTFDKWMRKASFLWCPVRSETEFFSEKEIYGISKMSGNVGDAIKYGKTAVFPAEYPAQLHSFIIREPEDMRQFILNPDAFSDFKTDSYEVTSVRSALENVLNSLLKS